MPPTRPDAVPRLVATALFRQLLDRRWLLVVFGAAALASLLGGLSLHAAAEPPNDAIEQRGGQITDLSIYTQAPQKEVDVNLFVDASSVHPTYSIDLILDRGKIPYEVLVLSTVADSTHLFRPVKLSFPENVPVYGDHLYYFLASSYTVDQDLQRARFVLPKTYFLNERGTLTVRLPTVGAAEELGGAYGLRAPFNNVDGQSADVEPLLEHAGASGTSISPDDYYGEVFNRPAAVFAAVAPLQFKANENVESDNYNMAVAQVQANSPSTGTFDGGFFSWAGHAGLGGYLSLVQPSALETRSSDDFLSGIFLATGAAALIAFFQELPESARTTRWVRKFATQRSVGTKASPAEPGPRPRRVTAVSDKGEWKTPN